ncbi:Uncharacterised protein [Mycobacteroides abscessus]|nr:Uncharacterised protein [Mycobacteroides abscessus]
MFGRTSGSDAPCATSSGASTAPVGTFSASRSPRAPSVGSVVHSGWSMDSASATETSAPGSDRQRDAISCTTRRAPGRTASIASASG